MSNVYICAPAPVEKNIHRVFCHDCKKKVFFVSFYYEWYGASSTCLNCGRQYSDGEWVRLDFYRGVRKHNIEAAKKHYRSIDIRTNNVNRKH